MRKIPGLFSEFCEPLEKIRARFLEKKFLEELRTGPQLEEESSHRTFDVSAPEDQLLDLSGPRHGRQHLEGVLAVDVLAAVNVELQQIPKHLEVLELACMRQRRREVEKRVGSAQCAIKRIRVLFSGAKDTKNGIHVK